MSEVSLTVLGGRGSIPVSGPEFVRYGGNTSCFALSRDGVAFAFIDAGTGLTAHASFGMSLDSTVAVFLTHYHWDHIQGLSMLDELWKGTCTVDVRGPGDPSAVLDRAISPPLFPVSIVDATSVRLGSIDTPVEVGGVLFTPVAVNHPQGALGYRVDGPRRSLAIITDHETGSDLDDGITDLIRGVDVLIHDAQYLPDEASDHVGWGHSTCEDAMVLAERVGASELILTSHAPNRTDSQIDEMVAAVTSRFAPASAAAQGMRVPL